MVRHFTSFSEAAKENARSRVLVGFHFTHATTVGIRHGVKIGNLTVRTDVFSRDIAEGCRSARRTGSTWRTS